NPGHQVQERRLPRSASAHERHEFALINAERSVPQRRNGLLPLAIFLAYIVNFNECHSRSLFVLTAAAVVRTSVRHFAHLTPRCYPRPSPESAAPREAHPGRRQSPCPPNPAPQ